MSLYVLLIKYEKRIEDLNKLQKLKLFLLPFLGVCFIYILFFSNNNSLKNIKNRIIFKRYHYDSLKTLKDFSRYCENNNILVKNLVKENEEISLQATSNQKKILKLLYHIENYDKYINIQELSITNNENFTLNLTISTNKEYKKSKIKNFIPQLAFLAENKSIKIDKINATVFNHSYLQKTWDN